MGGVRLFAQLTSACGMMFLLQGCAHNLVKQVPEGHTPSFSQSNAYLLVGLGGNAGGEDLAEVPRLIYQPGKDSVYVGFSEYDPQHPEDGPSCASLTWNMGTFPVPTKENDERRYALFQLPPGYYGFSDDRYSWFERGRITYVGDYVFSGSKKECPFYDKKFPEQCARIFRKTDAEAARKVLKSFGVPEGIMVVADKKFAKSPVKMLTCSP